MDILSLFCVGIRSSRRACEAHGGSEGRYRDFCQPSKDMMRDYGWLSLGELERRRPTESGARVQETRLDASGSENQSLSLTLHAC